MEFLKSVHRIVLIFGTRMGRLNASKVTFLDFVRKIRFFAIVGKKMAATLLIITLNEFFIVVVIYSKNKGPLH